MVSKLKEHTFKDRENKNNKVCQITVKQTIMQVGETITTQQNKLNGGREKERFSQVGG